MATTDLQRARERLDRLLERMDQVLATRRDRPQPETIGGLIYLVGEARLTLAQAHTLSPRRGARSCQTKTQ